MRRGQTPSPEIALDQAPPDNTGSTTFARYTYQAKVSFAWILACGNGLVEAIVAEYFEDVAIHLEDGRWQFVQVKTRDPSLGPWKLSQLLSADGAFRPLLRTFRALEDSVDFYLTAVLEGAGASGDDINLFVGRECTDPRVIGLVTAGLGLLDGEAERLVPKLRVRFDHPRTSIDAVNMRRLGDVAGRLTSSEVLDVYERCLATMMRSMAAELRIGDEWQSSVCDPDYRQHATTGKVITRDDLAFVVVALGPSGAPLLSRLLEFAVSPPSLLEEKLLAAGSAREVVEKALEARAMAAAWEGEQDAAALWPAENESHDVDIRLEQLSVAVLAGIHAPVSPGNEVWSRINERVHQERAVLDPRNLYRQDPVLLIGRVCGLSDLCRVKWKLSDG